VPGPAPSARRSAADGRRRPRPLVRDRPARRRPRRGARRHLPVALRYGARTHAVYRFNDDRYKFMQIAEFERKDQWEAYWYGPEFTDFRIVCSSWYQVPVLYGWTELVTSGTVARRRSTASRATPSARSRAAISPAEPPVLPCMHSAEHRALRELRVFGTQLRAALGAPRAQARRPRGRTARARRGGRRRDAVGARGRVHRPRRPHPPGRRAGGPRGRSARPMAPDHLLERNQAPALRAARRPALRDAASVRGGPGRRARRRGAARPLAAWQERLEGHESAVRAAVLALAPAPKLARRAACEGRADAVGSRRAPYREVSPEVTEADKGGAFMSIATEAPSERARRS
jgi:hypothetical protein